MQNNFKASGTVSQDQYFGGLDTNSTPNSHRLNCEQISTLYDPKSFELGPQGEVGLLVQ